MNWILAHKVHQIYFKKRSYERKIIHGLKSLVVINLLHADTLGLGV